VTTARPLPRYGALKQRARSRPCSDQLHHHKGHDLDRLRRPHREGNILRDHRWWSAGLACRRSHRGVAARDRVAPLPWEPL